MKTIWNQPVAYATLLDAMNFVRQHSAPAQPAPHVEQPTAALGWPDGISEPAADWATLLQAVEEQREAELTRLREQLAAQAPHESVTLAGLARASGQKMLPMMQAIAAAGGGSVTANQCLDEDQILQAAASIASQAAGTPAGQAADSDAQPATHVDQLAAALGWPGGISDPITSWQTLLRAAAELARAATPQPSQPAATIGRAATPEMIAAGAKAAREYYMATQGGNSPSVIWEAMYDAATASLPSPPAAPVEQDGSVHVECRRCTECCHTGINDARGDHAVCSSCDWSGREPGHDECPACGEAGTMSAACPDCGGRYHLIAEGDVSARAPSAAPQGGQEAGPALAEALAEKMADAECEPNEAAWRYMGATERASWIAAARVAIAALATQTAPQPSAVKAPEEIAEIIERLHTQDNRITADPLFAVQQKRRIYGIDTDRCDSIAWLDEGDDYREADPEEFAQFEAGRARGDDEPANWYRTGYIDIWEFVIGCFTEQGCKDYITRNGHNLKEPRIYAYGSYRNAEFIALRKWLMSLRSAAPSAQGAPQ